MKKNDGGGTESDETKKISGEKRKEERGETVINLEMCANVFVPRFSIDTVRKVERNKDRVNDKQHHLVVMVSRFAEVN